MMTSGPKTRVLACVASALCLTLLGPSVARGQVLTEEVVSYIDSLETSLVGAADRDEARSTTPKVVDRLLSGLTKKYSEIDNILRVNSKGKVANEVARDGKPGKRYRSVAGQDWFEKAGPAMEPYYANVKTRKGEYMLFWALPVTIKSGAGAKRSSGAMVYKIQFDKCLAKVAQKTGKPFRVAFEGATVYSSGSWKGSGAKESVLFDLKGFSGLTLEYVPEAAPGSAPAPAVAAAPATAGPAASAPAVKSTEEVRPAGAKAEKEAKPAKKGGGVGMIIFLVILVLIAGVGFFLWRQVQHYRQAEHSRLLSQIDGPEEEEYEEDEEEEEEETAPQSAPRRPVAPPRQPQPPPQQQVPIADMGGMTRKFAMPDPFAPVPAPQTQPPRQTQSMPMAQAGSPTRVPGPSQPPMQPGSTGQFSVDEYEKMRQHLRSEVTQELRQQMAAEFETMRKESSRVAEAFGGEITMVLHQLIGKISELGDNPTRLTELVGASIHELNATVNKYRTQGR